jgi:glyoxylase-like metal-dependent hydrolase (beta-lactamase superfamily II)
MRKVWTQPRGGTATPLRRSPLPERPEIHQLTLPLAKNWGPVDRVQVYLIEGDPLTLIDTGGRNAECRAVLAAVLEELGYGFADIERVIVTHAHRDHMGLVQSLRDAGAQLECLVHEADAETVECYTEVRRERAGEMIALFRENGVPETKLDELQRDPLVSRLLAGEETLATSVERRLRDGDRVAFKDYALRVHHSPGHTPGHILLEDEEHGLLWTGDQVMAHAIPNTENFYIQALPEPGDRLNRRPRFKGLVEMRRSLKRLRGQRFRRLLPGYGGIIDRAERAIQDILLFYDVRIQRIDRGLRHLAAMGQDVTVFELWQALFPQDESIDEMRTHLLTLIGALDCLEAEGRVRVERQDSILTHSSSSRGRR